MMLYLIPYKKPSSSLFCIVQVDFQKRANLIKVDFRKSHYGKCFIYCPDGALDLKKINIAILNFKLESPQPCAFSPLMCCGTNNNLILPSLDSSGRYMASPC